MARIYRRSRTYYSDIYSPSHPAADNRGRVRIPLDTDKDIAQKALVRLVEQRDAAKFGRVPKGTTFQEFKERVLLHASGKAKNTYEQYRRSFKELEAFKPVQTAAQITPDLLMELYTYWKTKRDAHGKLNPRGLYVRNRDLQSLKAAARMAEDWGLIQKGYNWKAAKRDKEPKGRLHWCSMEEIKKVYKKCSGVWLSIAKLAARAGLRRSEIYWLAWGDVDFDRKRLHVSPKPQWVPKDHESRWIPMPNDLISHLGWLPRASEWVLGDERPDPGTMTTIFRRIMREAGMKGSLHTLRHSYISDLMSNGAPPKWVQDVAGHSKIEMTMRYTHLAPSSQQQITNFLSPA